MNRPAFRERRHDDDGMMIYGLRPVMEALQEGKEMDRIFITRGARGNLMTELKQMLRNREMIWQEVPIEKMNRLTRNNHQDVVCFISPIEYTAVEQLVPHIFERGETPFLLVLDRITDVRNFGAIARTAECSGVHGIIVPARGGAQISSDAVRTSAGALHKIPVCKENSLSKTLDFLRESGIKVVAASEKAGKYVFKETLEGPLAVVMGSEEDGVSNELLKKVDAMISIPMKGSIASLNVSVACGMILYEVNRQRFNASK